MGAIVGCDADGIGCAGTGLSGIGGDATIEDIFAATGAADFVPFEFCPSSRISIRLSSSSMLRYCFSIYNFCFYIDGKIPGKDLLFRVM